MAVVFVKSTAAFFILSVAEKEQQCKGFFRTNRSIFHLLTIEIYQGICYNYKISILFAEFKSRGEFYMKPRKGAAVLCAACLIGTGASVLPAPAAVHAAEEAPLVYEGLKYETAEGGD